MANNGDYPLVNIPKTMGNHPHFSWVNPLFQWSMFNSKLLVNTRGYEGWVWSPFPLRYQSFQKTYRTFAKKSQTRTVPEHCPQPGLNPKISEIWDSAVWHTGIFTSLHRVFYHGAKASPHGRLQISATARKPRDGEVWRCDTSRHCEVSTLYSQIQEQVHQSIDMQTSHRGWLLNSINLDMSMYYNIYIYTFLFCPPILGWWFFFLKGQGPLDPQPILESGSDLGPRAWCTVVAPSN